MSSNGQTVNQQELNELLQDLDFVLGKGAYGSVRALKSNPDEVVKEISTANLSEKARLALDTELDLLPRVRHQYIVDYKQVIRTPTFTYIRMRRYAKSLSEVIVPMHRKSQKPELDMILRLTAQMCEALAYLHSPFKPQAMSENKIPSIVHRDIKPANILTDDKIENFFLADFGMCRTVTNSVCASTYAGSPAYMAPEVMFHEHYDGKADIWSLGVVIYEMAYGRVPDFLRGMPPKSVYVNTWRPDLAKIDYPELHDVIKAMLVVDPQKRSSAADVLRIPCVSSYVNTKNEITEPGKELEHLLEFHIKDAVKDRDKLISNLQAEITQLKTQIDILNDRLARQQEQQQTLQADMDTKAKLLEDMYSNMTKTSDPNAMDSVSVHLHASDAALAMRDRYIKNLIETNKKLTKKLSYSETAFYGLSSIRSTGSILSSSTKLEGGCVTSDTNDSSESLNSLVQKFVVSIDRVLLRRLAQSITSHLDEAGSGVALTTLLTGKLDGNYILSPQRGALIRLLADREGSMLVNSGYSTSYIECLQGKPTVEQVTQPDGWNSWFRHVEQGCTVGVEKAMYMVSSVLPSPIMYGELADNGFTALMMAAALDHVSLLSMLVTKESGRVTAEGRTALMCAAHVGNIGSACLLLATEAKLRDKKKRVAIHYAAEAGHTDVVQVLMAKEGGLVDAEGTTSLMLAAKAGFTRIVSILIQKEGRKLNKTGATALMYASKWGHLEVVKLLLPTEGRKLNKMGLSALMIAAQYGQLEICETLLTVEDGLVAKTGMTAMMYAAQTGQKDIVKLLMPRQARLRDKIHATALMYAATRGQHDVVALLANEEAGMVDISGLSALVYAAYKGHFKCVDILAPLEAKAHGERAIQEMIKSHRQTIMPIMKNKIEEYMHK